MIYPKGKCHQKYGQYIGWSFLSNVIVSVENVMVTDSMLVASNFQSFQYISKDILGQIGGLMYISRMGKKSDEKPKRFLLYSSMIEQCAYHTSYLTQKFPSYFLPIAGISNIFLNISFVGYGAINAKCIQSLSIENNIGELYSKIVVINTLGSSIGTMIGLGIISITDYTSRMFLFPVLAFLRIYTFRKAIKDIL
jgi:hypothetical protein